MGWLSDLFKKSEGDPAYSASQQSAEKLMGQIAGAKLPPLPTLTAAQQGMGNMPAINPNPIGLPAYLGGGQRTVFPVGLPNQISMLANQLSAGGYGRPQIIQNQMTGPSGYYEPTVISTRLPPIAARPVAAAAAPVVAAVKAPVKAVVKPAVKKPPVKKPMGFTGVKAASQSGGGGQTDRTSSAGYGYGYRG